MMDIVTGYTGVKHVTADNEACRNMGFAGANDYVLKVGRQLEASIISNNEIRVYDGDVLMQGRHGSTIAGSYDALTISNGEQSLLRNDLIVARYSRDTESSVEKIKIVVVEGVAGKTAVDPDITTGDIRAGDVLHEMVLYRVVLNGLTVEGLVSLFSVLSTIEENDKPLISTIEELEANTLSGRTVDALVVKGFNENLGDNELIYEDGSYYIQNGGDESTKKKLGSQKIALATTSASSFSITVGNYYDGDLAELTAANFLLEFSKATRTTSSCVIEWSGSEFSNKNAVLDSSTVTPTKLYNSGTGVLTANVSSSTVTVNGPQQQSNAAYIRATATIVTNGYFIPYLIV